MLGQDWLPQIFSSQTTVMFNRWVVSIDHFSCEHKFMEFFYAPNEERKKYILNGTLKLVLTLCFQKTSLTQRKRNRLVIMNLGGLLVMVEITSYLSYNILLPISNNLKILTDLIQNKRKITMYLYQEKAKTCLNLVPLWIWYWPEDNSYFLKIEVYLHYEFKQLSHGIKAPTCPLCFFLPRGRNTTGPTCIIFSKKWRKSSNWLSSNNSWVTIVILKWFLLCAERWNVFSFY